MNCATLMPEPEDQHDHVIEKEKDRRTSHRLTSCLRGERDEADGKFPFKLSSFTYSIHRVEWGSFTYKH